MKPQELIEKDEQVKQAALSRTAKLLVLTIEATGGVKRNRKGCIVPAIDEEWTDMGDVYREACVALGLPMQFASEQEEWDTPDDDQD